MFVPKGTPYLHVATFAPNLNIYEIHPVTPGLPLKTTPQPAFTTTLPLGARPMFGVNSFLSNQRSPIQLSATGQAFFHGKTLTGVAKADAVDQVCKLLTTEFKTNHFTDKDGENFLSS